jgi:hypothetical protein
MPAEPSQWPTGPEAQNAHQPVFTADSAAAETASNGPPPSSPEKGERVRLVGRLGKDPLFRITTNQKLVGQFPLAVRLDEETVKWETIVAHGDRAAKLRDERNLAKGQAVEVIGYRHVKRRKDKAGNERTVEEIYAVAVIPR